MAVAPPPLTEGLLATLKGLVELGDRFGPSKDVPIAEQMKSLASRMLDHPSIEHERLAELFIDCVSELSPKTTVYVSLLAHVIRSGGVPIGQAVIRQCAASLEDSLRDGRHQSAVPVLRLLCAMTDAKVLSSATASRVLQSLLTAAIKCARSSIEQRRPAPAWQLYSDSLATASLSCLPYCRQAMAASEPKDVAAVLDLAKEYMTLRATPRCDLRFSPTVPAEAGDAPPPDSGAASHLTALWDALQECEADGGARWPELVVVRPPDAVCAWRKEAGVDVDEPLQGWARPLDESGLQITVPWIVPGISDAGSPAEVAARVLAQYGPRGGINLLPRDAVNGGAPNLERIMTDDLIIETLVQLHGQRVLCVKRLATINTKLNLGMVLAETLFGQLLRLPAPRHRPIAYFNIMTDLAGLKNVSFARPMSGCMKELFRLSGVLLPDVFARVGEYLAYHLCTHGMFWPWERWAHVVDAPAHDPQRRFCQHVLFRLLRASYHSKVKETLPESMHVLLQPEPAAQMLPPEADDDAAAVRRTRDLLPKLKAKASTEEVKAWVEAEGVLQDVGGVSALVGVVARAVLLAGAKSFAHTLAMLERYTEVLEGLIMNAGEPGRVAAVQAAAAVWAGHRQRFAMVVGKAMSMRLVTPETLITWAAAEDGLVAIEDEVAFVSTWEVFCMGVSRAISRESDARGELAAAKAELAAAQMRLQGAQRAAEDAGAAKEEAAKDPPPDKMDEDTGGPGPGGAPDDKAGNAVEEAARAVEKAKEELEAAEVTAQEAAEEERRALLLAVRSLAGLLPDPLPAMPSAHDLRPARVVADEKAAAAAAEGRTEEGSGAMAVDGEAEPAGISGKERSARVARQVLLCLASLVSLHYARFAPLAVDVKGLLAKKPDAVRGAVLGVFAGAQ
ncbi:unnamed protein product [Pedinophyceae sp. YPF-701]|nr:unnamed protein product [Pedinophyceae sp. YPF-701]